MPYKDDLKCTKVIGENGEQCGKSPAREIEVLKACLCKEHQEALSKFINHQLGEDNL
jgi:hypothetical protein